ncbi:hypothetical protein [Asticcacaulis taihuensis]|uniref:hypothetical protein n=1 Tax=Asticcacaulis taihuensis TaxID=260084 RepID=UPI0026EEA20F|nr:hypothetical protein [Asticcacaulis taihuensis]
MNTVRALTGGKSKAQKAAEQAAQAAQLQSARDAEQQAALQTATSSVSGARLRLGGRRSLAFGGQDYSGGATTFGG